MEISLLLIILVFRQISHFIFDFTSIARVFQTAKERGKPEWVISIHGLTHAIGAWVIFSIFIPGSHSFLLFQLFMIQFMLHSVIDIGKSKLSNSYPKLKNTNQLPFWTTFGADQMLHQLTIIFEIYFLITHI